MLQRLTSQPSWGDKRRGVREQALGGQGLLPGLCTSAGRTPGCGVDLSPLHFPDGEGSHSP